MLFSMVLLLEVIERRQLDFPSSHACVCECVRTCCCCLTYHSSYHCACVCVCVCRQSAVIQAYLQPRGLAADCSLKVRTHDLQGPGADQCPGVLLSLSHRHPSVHTRQLPIHTHARTTRPLGRETLYTHILSVDTRTQGVGSIYMD